MVEGHKNIIQVWNGCFGQIWCNYVNWLQMSDLIWMIMQETTFSGRIQQIYHC